MNFGKKIIITTGAFVITFVTICVFFQNDIKYLLTSRSINKSYALITENEYYIENNFYFLDNYKEDELKNKDDIIKSIYYLINSGVNYSEIYCSKDYNNCYEDFNDVVNDKDLLSLINNFVHPYNTFDNISFEISETSIKVKIKHIYNNNEIKEIDKIVDDFIEKNINNSMSTKDKIKVIHDYIINNTDYDKLKTINIKDSTYKSNTAYGVLIEHYGICSGYSDTMAIFLNKLNIINYRISNKEHIWNLIYLNGKWYHLDLTWDDPINDKNITRDNYFLIDTDTLYKLNDNEHDFDKNIFKEAV